MSTPSTSFRFVDPGRFQLENSHLGRVPAGVVGKAQLMQSLSEALRFPDYFGRNWDALSECLRDLSWLPPGRVVLVHDALPELPSKDLHTYVEVLDAAVKDWKPGESYELVVVFAESDRGSVLEHLRA
ncbi:hypothetical protein D7X30_30105 [Corallococcus sp. AB011P]|uniref:barstar family protein n=1 Tax=unclassified Corallococcus TaxID=2685029 RepID=UPI000EA02021|nr:MULTISPECIES: barstar family protein [unclassified Corallococcus]RKG53717.1 hypothetical protein D7X30_30105 [Corallococcus sp. AB011P]RKH83023.1 hypothetical protein D7Y21_27355 [Corallococcus sp. AB045]